MVFLFKVLINGLLLSDQSVYKDVATPQQASVEQYNIIKFLGGSGPYKQHPGFGISTEIPMNCQIQQVQMLSRHGERYPSKGDGKAFEDIMKIINDYDKPFRGDLAFLNEYKYFVTNTSNYEKETNPLNSNSVYCGVTNALRHGKYFKERYGKLYKGGTFPVFTSNSGRCFETSTYFAKGFLGDEIDNANYVIIDEDGRMGANSLTPRYACPEFHNNNEKIEAYDLEYLENIQRRFENDNPGLKLSNFQISRLFLWCAFEINVNGDSPFCSLFTTEEFIREAYRNDLTNYYSNGDGNPISRSVGTPLLQASLKLLKQVSSDKTPIYVSFTHDTDIEVFLSSLGLVAPIEDLPVDRIPFPNPYNSADLLPQAARLYIEKMSCSDGMNYVRFILNDAVIPLRKCQNGPGFSCELSKLDTYVTERTHNFSFAEDCKSKSDVPRELNFFWDYESIKYNATLIDQ